MQRQKHKWAVGNTLSLPLSTTYTTSSMVRLVSAMLVASTTLRMPSGGRSKTLRCSVGEMLECRGSTRRWPSLWLRDAVSRSYNAVISPSPAPCQHVSHAYVTCDGLTEAVYALTV